MTINYHNKLVRDKVVEEARARGLTVASHVIEDDAQYVAALADKLVEEAKEFAESHSLEAVRIEELADVYEAVMTLALMITTFDHLEAVRKAKAVLRGAFAGRVYLESIEDDQ